MRLAPGERFPADANAARFAASSARAMRASVCFSLSSRSMASFFSRRFSICSVKSFSSSSEVGGGTYATEAG